MAIKILVGGQMKTVADVIQPGVISRIGGLFYIYTSAAWLLCDGSAISRTAYADLFAAIGTTFGSGDGVNTFNVPTQAQANRPTVNVAANSTLAQFATDTDIIVDNPAAAYIDISAGASGAGIRISIIEKSSQGVTIYTDAGHTQSAVLPKGALLLEWDGTQWHLLSSSMKFLVTIAASGVWKTPFVAKYNLIAIGGGGGGGNALLTSGTATYAGGGGGGSGQMVIKALSSGVTITIGIGGGGGPTAAGGTTSISDGIIAVYGYGGNPGGSAGSGSASGGGAGNALCQVPFSIPAWGFGGAGGNGSTGGAGGASTWNLGTGGPGYSAPNNGGNGSGYGSGGGGASATVYNPRTGGYGSNGVAFVEF